MKGRTKRPNEIEEKVETNNEKKSKVRKISTTINFIASTRARLSEVSSEVKSEPIHRKKSRYCLFSRSCMSQPVLKSYFILN
jgi:hypothetical protein